MAKRVPWQYFIVHGDSPHLCPAVALNRRYLLASQSCLRAFNNCTRDFSDLMIYPSLPTDAVCELVRQGEDVPRVARFNYHPDYQQVKPGDPGGGAVGDVTLVEVSGEVDMTLGNLAPVCLPSVSVRSEFRNAFAYSFWMG